MRLSDVDTISHISLFLNEKDTVSSVWQYLFSLLHNTKSTYIKKEGDAHEYS